MYPTSQEFQEKMKQQFGRRTFGKVQIDYTSPFLDQSITVDANENANVSYPAQTADAVLEPFAKIPSLDGSWVLDGSFALAPGPDETDTHQMGWWGSQLSQADGTFVQPYPTLTVTHFARPIHSLQVVGDSLRNEYPVDFRIDLYGSDDMLLYTENVSGSTEMIWSKALPSPVLNVAKQVLTIMKWSHPGRQAKILEFFTSIQEIYEDDDIISIHLLEEREVSQGSLPIGTISANEIEIRLNNETRKFDAGNKQSPLYQALRVNRRIKAWLGVNTAEGKEYVPLGTFWSSDWRVPEDGIYAQTIGRDRLELLRKSTYSTSEVLPKPIELIPPTFTRASKAYLSDGTEVDAGAPRFEQGKFDRALLVEGGTTNQIAAPTMFAGWASISGGTVLDNDGSFYPSQAKFARVTTTTWGFQSNSIPAANGQTWSVSYIARRGTGDGEPCAAIMIMNASDSHVSNINPTFSSRDIGGGWVRYEATFTINRADTGYIRLRFYVTATNGGYHDFALPQLEQKPYITSFIDGTRSPEILIIPTEGVLNPQEGTVEFWARMLDLYSRRRDMFTVNKSVSSDDRVIFGYNVTGTGLELHWRPANATAYDIQATNLDIVTDWVYVGFRYRWNGTGYDLALFYNGQVVATGTATNGQMTNFYQALLGCTDIGSGVFTNHADMLFDDLRISSRARTDEEILATYNSNIPAIWDEDTTYLLRFDGNFDSAQQTTITLYNLAKIILTDAGLTEEEYFIDPELKQFSVPYAYFEPQSHREALRKVAEACLGQVYCDREGVIHIEGPSFLQSQTEPVITITPSDYFRKDNPVKWSEIANYIEVETQPLRPDVVQEVYRSNEPVPITAGQTKIITAYYNHTPCIEATATLENAVSGAQITKATYYAWGADITVTSTNTGTFELVINAKPLKVLNKEKAIAKDDASITDNGMLKYTFPANSLVQTREVAQKIADILLAYYKNPRRDVEVEWRGNPALLLGDRIAVIDKNETNEYYVTRQELEFDGALRARLSGRRV